MSYLPWLAGSAAIGYGLGRRGGRRATDEYRRRADLYLSGENPRVLPSPRYSSLVYHCGSRGVGEPFSLGRSGGGEGHGAFGKGIYFSSRRSVAEDYCKYVNWPELTVAVITKPLLNGKPKGDGGDWNCVDCPPTQWGQKQCWCPEGVLAAGYAGVRVQETSGPKYFSEIVVYDPSAIRVVKTIDAGHIRDADMERLEREEPDRAAFLRKRLE